MSAFQSLAPNSGPTASGPVAALEGCRSIRSDATILFDALWHKPNVRPISGWHQPASRSKPRWPNKIGDRQKTVMSPKPIGGIIGGNTRLVIQNNAIIPAYYSLKVPPTLSAIKF